MVESVLLSPPGSLNRLSNECFESDRVTALRPYKIHSDHFFYIYSFKILPWLCKKNELRQSHCIKMHYSAQVSEDYNLSLSLFSVCKHDRQRAQVMNGQNWIKYTVITSRQPAAQWGMGPQIYHSIVWGFYQLGLPLHLWFILQFIIPDLSVCVAGVTAPQWITG